MYLYLVTCVYQGHGYENTIQVYIIANNPDAATQRALQLMRTVGWNYTDWVSEIQLLASVNTHRAPLLFAIDNPQEQS